RPIRRKIFRHALISQAQLAELAYEGKSVGEGVDVGGLRVDVAGGASSGGNAETLEERKSGEVAGANGDARPIKSANDVGGRGLLQGKRKDGDAIGSGR